MSDHQQYHGLHPVLSAFLTSLSFLGAFLWALTLKDAQIAFGFCASAVAIVAGYFAIRNHIYSTRKIKKEIEYYNRKNKLKNP